MFYNCSQCSFTAQFESALTMHHQLHHETTATTASNLQEKSNTVPRSACLDRSFSPTKENKRLKLATRTSSATRLFDKLRARIRRSRNLFAHPEEGSDPTLNFNDLPGQSECTSKAMKELGSSVSGVIEALREQKEIFACHLCSFDSDRITVLDRHLLNDHKIGLDNLLKLVMAKTKDGLSDDSPAQIYGIRQPYYKPPDEIIENGEFIIETITPKIKILKHTSMNTDLKMADIPDLNDCQKISEEIEKLIDTPQSSDNNVLLEKMQTLNECMCKFVDSTNTIKKVLTKEFDQKGNRSKEGPYFNLGLGDQDSPKDWERAHSEKLDRNRSKYPENRSEKIKYSSDSFYF
nr:uncharacterized protein LOC117994691 [Maniola hyperantus]